MAMYAYKCKNEKCEDFDKEVSVSKPMDDYDREEQCEKCKEQMTRIFGLGGHQTFGDGYKS